MTIANVFLSRYKALIGTDTAAIDQAGEQININKMYYVPHVNAVMTGRGTQGFMLYLYSAVLADPATRDCTDFDSFVEAIQPVMNNLYIGLNTNPPPGTDRSMMHLLAHQEVILVGWSARLNKMRGIFLTRRSLNSDMEIEEIEEPGIINPWMSDTWGEQPEGDGERGMAKICFAQVHFTKKEAPHIPMGGNLMLATLTRDNVTFSTADDLDSGKGWKSEMIMFTTEELRAANPDADLSRRLEQARPR